MAPKRSRVAAAEAERAVAELQGQSLAETLASASGQNVELFLDRASKRRARFPCGGAEAPTPLLSPFKAQAMVIEPGLPPARKQQLIGACGAAAIAELDGPDPAKVDDPPQFGAGAMDSPLQEQQLRDQEQEQQEEHQADEEDWEDAWGEVDEDDGEASMPVEHRDSPGSAAGGDDDDGGLTITLHRDGSEEGEAKALRKAGKGGSNGSARRQGVTKVDRLRAQLVHRSHLLALLARGLLLDAAASDLLLQAQLLSLVEPGPAAKLQEARSGLADSADGASCGVCVSLRGVRQQLSWLRSTFRLATPTAPSVEDPVIAAVLRAQGLQAVGDGLREAVAQRRCTGEQLAALFAAALRAQGAMVRLVRVLQASALKPTDAQRQQQRAAAAFSRKFGASGSRYLEGAAAPAAAAAVSGPAAAGCCIAQRVAAAIEDLVSGRAAREVDAQRAAMAHRCNLPDDSAVHCLGPQAAMALLGPDIQASLLPNGSLLVIDEKRAWQQKKKAKAERKAAMEARCAAYSGGLGASSDGGLSRAQAPATGKGGAGRGGKSGHGPAGGSKSGTSSKGKASRGPQMLPNAAAATVAAAGGAGGPAASSSVPTTTKRRTSAPASAAVASSAATCLTQKQPGAEQEEGQREALAAGPKRKRKGDLAEEAELAAALAASALATDLTAGATDISKFAAEEKLAPGEDIRLEARGRRQMISAKGIGDQKGVEGAAEEGAALLVAGTGGCATISTRQPDVGQCWVEVFCWNPDADADDDANVVGRWVHVDPLTNAVDKPLEVEANLPREYQPLAYVVALAGAGAKDVTQRYTSNWATAEKLRDEDWWQRTLGPLRMREAAASMAAGAAGGSLDACGGGVLGPRAAAAARRQQEKAAKSGRSAAELAAQREDAEMAERVQRERRSLPSTMEGFRTHALYVLERHIPKYWVVKPEAKKAGMHRGEPYYRRTDLVEVHTAGRWRRDFGLEVRPEELERPVKRVKRRAFAGTKSAAAAAAAAAAGSLLGDDAAGDEDEDEEGDGAGGGSGDGPKLNLLYGMWQTQEWRPVPVGGRIPTNEHGNVEVPPFASVMPEGTVHLNYPYITRTCKALGVEHVPALVGFERRRGGSFPKLSGVVVWEKDQQRVMDTYLAAEREKEEKKRLKREAEADAAWRTLLRAVLARVRLQQSYGQPEQQAGAGAMADAAAALLQQNVAAPSGRAKLHKSRGGGKKATAGKAAAGAADADVVVDLAVSDSDTGPKAATAPPHGPARSLQQLRSKLQADLSPQAQQGKQARQASKQQPQREQCQQHMVDVEQEDI